MDDKAMSESRFTEILAAYGADESRWPKAERAAARALVHSRPQLMAKLAQDEAGLDAALANWQAPEVPAALSRRILDSFPVRMPQVDEFSFTNLLRLVFGERERAPALAMASILLLLAIGSVGGVMGSAALSNGNSNAVILSQAFDSGDGLGLSDLETSS